LRLELRPIHLTEVAALAWVQDSRRVHYGLGRDGARIEPGQRDLRVLGDLAQPPHSDVGLPSLEFETRNKIVAA